MFVCDKRDRAITCMLCRVLHSALMFSGFYKKICLKMKELESNSHTFSAGDFQSEITDQLLSNDNNSEFTQQDGRKKRTAKCLCVTNVTGL